MCDQCNSGLSPAAFNKRLNEDIMDNGFKVVIVQTNIPDREPGYPAYNFGYTVGRSLFGKAELFVCGAIPDQVMHYMLNEAARLVDEQNVILADGVMLPPDTVLADYAVNVVEIDPIKARMNKDIELYGPTFTAYQLVWPDMNHLFPGDAGYEYADNNPEVQPVYTKE